MQITFFVGNGFDVSCGINSTYSQFYEWYIKQEKSELEHVNTFRQKIDQEIHTEEGMKKWADFEKALGEYTKNFTVDTVQQFIDCYNDANEKLMEYLQKERDRFDKELISDSELQKFINGLKGFYLELTPKERQVIEQLFKDTISENRIINFISYNYTDTLDKCVSYIGSQPLAFWKDPLDHSYKLSANLNVVHAHGRLTQNPVFGVNDESQIANKDLLSVPDFASIIIKPKCVEELGEFWHDDINALIKNSTIICIFGMSMGETDKIWFYKIMEWLNANSARQLIIYWQTKEPSKNQSITRFFSNRREARNKILNYFNCSNDVREKLGSRIHILENTKTVLRVSLKEKNPV